MNERGNISQTLNIALAILLLIALAVTVYSINQVRSLQSEAKLVWGPWYAIHVIVPSDDGSYFRTYHSLDGENFLQHTA